MSPNDSTHIRSRRRWLPLGLFVFAALVQTVGLMSSATSLGGDGARLAINTLDFLQRGVWPFYMYNLGAPNPLIIFLQAPLIAAFGPQAVVVRGLTAFMAALASPLAYRLCCRLFARSDPQLATRAGVMAGLALALSPIFGIMSRLGTEHILLVVLAQVVVIWLWQGIWRGQWFYFVLGGLALGLSQYSYIVARAFALALAGALVMAQLLQPQFKLWWRGLGLAMVTAVVVMIPQLYLFIVAPPTLTARTDQASGQFIFELPNTLSLLATKMINQLLMLGWHWDTGYNPFSGRPLLNPVLLIGLVIAAVAILRVRKAPYVFLLALTSFLLIPDLITYEGLTPSATRLMVAYPFIFIIASLGCALAWRWLDQQPNLPGWSGGLVLGAVVLAGLEGQWDYFGRVLPQMQAETGVEWKLSEVEAAEAAYIRNHGAGPILISSSEYQRAPLTVALLALYPNRVGTMVPPLSPGEGVTVMIPSDPERATTDGPPAGYIADEWVLLEDGKAYYLPPMPHAVELSGTPETLYASNGVRAATVSAGTWRGVQPEVESVQATFKNGLEIVGAQTSPLTPGQPATVTLYWRRRQTLAADVQVFVQILDRNDTPIASIHDWPLHGTYRVRAWQLGETVPLSYTLMIPADAPPGPYRLAAGVFDILEDQRVPLVDGTDLAPLTLLKIPLPATATTPQVSLKTDFGSIIQLNGYSLQTSPAGLQLKLYWQALSPPTVDYTVFVHLVDTAGALAAQKDSQPRDGQYPTSIWAASETVEDAMQIPVGAGNYQVFVGLYQWDTGARLPARLDGQAVADNQVLLATIQIP